MTTMKNNQANNSYDMVTYFPAQSQHGLGQMKMQTSCSNLRRPFFASIIAGHLICIVFFGIQDLRRTLQGFLEVSHWEEKTRG